MPDFGSYDTGGKSFYEVLTAAINDMAEHGYDSLERVAYWLTQLRLSAARSLTPEGVLASAMARMLQGSWRSLVERARILRFHPGVSRFTLDQVKPRLRAELDRRIFASADLIKLNRQEAMERTLRRFSGWATSVPPGGSEVVDKRKEKDDIRKPLRSLSFVERRVATDQGHKFAANLSEILATDTGAIAGIWYSNWRQANYDYREPHRERDMRVYLVRGSWADERGYVRSVDGYTDEITKPGEEVYCRCHYQWITSLGRMPDAALTERGRAARDAAREVVGS